MLRALELTPEMFNTIRPTEVKFRRLLFVLQMH